MVVHPLLERFWEPVGANLTDVHGEHDQVEIPRNTRSRSEAFPMGFEIVSIY